MVEDKKNEEEKTVPQRKASTGAWWKSTVAEDSQQPAVAQGEEQAAEPAAEKSAEGDAGSSPKKSPRKRSPKKSEAQGGDEPLGQSADESAPALKALRKRAPRKKKTADEPAEPDVLQGEGADDTIQQSVLPDWAAEDALSQGPGTEAEKSKRKPRKRGSRSKKPAESVAEEGLDVATVEVPEVAGRDEASAEQVEVPAAAEEAAPVPAAKRSSRKRSSRKKKPAAAIAAEADEPSAVAAEPGVAEEPIKEMLVEAGGEPVPEVQAEPSRRSSRKRSHKKKKSSVPAAAEAVVGDAEQALSADEVIGEGAESAPAAEGVEGEAGQERKRKRPSHRRSRNKRKGAAKLAEAPVMEDRAQVDEEEEWPELDDDFADDDEFDSYPGHDRRDGYRRREDEDEDFGAELPELPDDEELDEEKQNRVLKLLINAEEPEECRLALLENGRLDSIHVSTINRAQTKNNIYKARIVAIEPNLQAAFVDYGTEKNGFLPFSEIHPEYYKEDLSPEVRKLVETHHWKKLSITDVVEKNQEVMVQVVKEEVGKKGANMTTYLSLPGRSLVLMPGSDSSGISRKISGEERRAQLRTAMNSLDIPEGIGWIVRTAGSDITRSALARDVGYLLRLWDEIKKKAQDMQGVGQVYEDHQSVLRFLREHFDPAIEEILVDDEQAMEQVNEFVSMLPEKQQDVKVRLHKGSRPIFNQYSIEDQIESIYQPRVSLPSGGSIVIEPTEALVSIDVNSGSTSKGKNFDQSIFQANLEAASELARQLRLRDLGGLIVVDFIDMRNKKHIRDVERMVKISMRRDKAKVDFTRISKFGLMQISRQKLASPIEAGNYRVCHHCKGRGTVRSVETLALFYLRRIQTGASRKQVSRVECHFPLDVAQYLLNKKRQEILEHETRYDTEIAIIGDPGMSPSDHEITLHKAEKEPNEKKQG